MSSTRRTYSRGVTDKCEYRQASTQRSGSSVPPPETLNAFPGVSVSVHHDPDGTVVVVARRSAMQ
jgi:hypothetical protein